MDQPSRRPTRATAYDYASPGAYFVTMCAQNRACLFGDVVDGEMVPTVAGLMVESWWEHVPTKFPSVVMDAFIVMPNHLHGIVMLGSIVDDGAGPPSNPGGPGETGLPSGLGGHMGPPLHQVNYPDGVGEDPRVLPCHEGAWASHQSPTLGNVIQWFKTMTTNDYIRGVRDHGFPPFDRRVWQRTYHDHIIRNERDMERIRAYIEGNPANWATDPDRADR